VIARHKVVTENLNTAAPISMYISGRKLFTLKKLSQKLANRTGSCLKRDNRETLKEKENLYKIQSLSG